MQRNNKRLGEKEIMVIKDMENWDWDLMAKVAIIMSYGIDPLDVLGEKK